MKTSQLGLCAAVLLLCASAVASSASEPAASDRSSPVFGVSLPPGYRHWEVVAPALEAEPLNELRIVLGNPATIRAYREGILPFPDGTILAKLAWKQVRPPEFAAASIPGAATTVQVMVKDSKRYAATGGYRTVSPLAVNRWGLAGTWTIGSEFATLNVPAGRIAYRFHARDLHLVLAPSAPARSIRVRVTLDGVPPGADHGADVDAEGWGGVQGSRLYQLIRQSGPITDRTFEIEFSNAGVRAYVFTFG